MFVGEDLILAHSRTKLPSCRAFKLSTQECRWLPAGAPTKPDASTAHSGRRRQPPDGGTGRESAVPVGCGGQAWQEGSTDQE